MSHYKIIIIGSGPAAHTAAIYAGRAFLNPLMFEGFMAGGIAAGGQLTTTTDIENFPGFPDGIQGLDLVDKLREQSIKSGTTIITETISYVDFSKMPFILKTESNDSYTTEAVIIATGAIAKRLHLPDEDRLWQKGISACAVCDGPAPIFRGKEIVVIGGGDSASEEANFLTKYASHVYVLVRKDVLRASAIMAKKMKENPKISILYNTVAVKVSGKEKLEGVHILHLIYGTSKILKVSGLFYAIGHTPNTEIFKNTKLNMDQNGYIITKESVTNIPGVFACGDVQDHRYRQAITAAGSGCMASMNAEKYLSEK